MTAPARTAAGGTAALVWIDPTQGTRSLAFRYNPATVRRTYTPNTVGGTPAMRSPAVRFSAAASETISLECRFSAVDDLDAGNPAGAVGVAPQLATLALLASPTTAQVTRAQQLLDAGAIDVVPPIADPLLLVWGRLAVQPVRIESLEIVEELFDTHLWPVQATATLGLRSVTYSDIDPAQPTYHQAVAYQHGLEQLARSAVQQSGTSP